MPKASAPDKKACTEMLSVSRLNRLGRLIASIVLLSLTLVLSATNAEARGTPWWAKWRYTLQLAVSYSYQSDWGDKIKKRSSLTQNYNLNHTGYIVDPRLANYSTGIRFADRTAITDNAGEYTTTGFDVRLTMFEGINRGKGLAMWNYVPSPLNVWYSLDMFDGGGRSHSYGFSMYYTRQGSLRVFANRKVIYYDDGTNNNDIIRRNLNGNRYRYKYNNSNYNVNGNGGSNWNSNRNGNSNSNWNNNGYVNRNRNVNNGNINRNRNLDANANANGNGNGNQNLNFNSNIDAAEKGKNGTNSNWNRNSNANLNGNSNWNRNWNRNFNYNNNYDKHMPGMGLFSFAYPRISLEANRNRTTYGSGTTYDATMANLRISINNPPRKKANKEIYRSDYLLSYGYRDELTRGTRHTLTLLDSHQWQHYLWRNNFHYQSNEGSNYFSADTTLGYWNEKRIKNQVFPYNLGVSADYSKSGDASTWGVNASAKTSAERTKRLMPGLISRSRVQVDFGKKQNKAGMDRTIYTVSLTENLVSTQFRKVAIYGAASTGYSESGVPVSISTYAISSPTSRLKLNGGYSFATFFHKEYRGMTLSHSWWFGGEYLISPRLKYVGGIGYSLSTTRNGTSYSFGRGKISNQVSWLINSKSNMDVYSTYEFSDAEHDRTLTFSVQYRNRILRTGSLFVYGSAIKRESSKAEKEMVIGYSMEYRRFSFSASYELKINSLGDAAHRLNLSVGRTFGRSFSRLW